jgi:ABC-type sugar transport system permease subunit
MYPLARSVVLSFYRSAGPRENEFIGFSNYSFLFRDWLFWKAVINTVGFTVIFLSLQIPLSLALAMLLNHPQIRARSVFRFIFFSSHLVGHVFVGLLFMMLLSPRSGIVNRALGQIPFLPNDINWRGDSRFVMPALIMASLWISIGYGMIYFLAALQTVDRELYEAAEVDGAGFWGRFLHITLPGIRPVMVFILMVGTVGAFQLFELPYVLFDPPTGPGLKAMTIVMYLYQQGFEFGNIGYAAAVGWVLAAMLFLVTGLQAYFIGALKD